MCVKLFGRPIDARAEPIRNGYFVRCSDPAAFGLEQGSVVEVDGTKCLVYYLIANSCGEPEVWALLTKGLAARSVSARRCSPRSVVHIHRQTPAAASVASHEPNNFFA